MRLLLAKDCHPIEKPAFRGRLSCWLRGGHDFYRNNEFGEMWCRGPCGGVWHLDFPVDNR